ncbi:aldehyde dehydrogenase [Roseivivax sp. CAU 1761]
MAEYHAIARNLRIPAQILVGDSWRGARSGATFDTVNPATGETLAALPACAAADVDDAVAAARAAFRAGVWEGQHPSMRKGVLHRLAALIEENGTELAVLESLDSGKPISDCLSIDIPETANCLRWHGEAQDKLYGQIAPSAPDALGLIVREPVGVVAAVLPWNFPLMMMAWKIGPALATGNSVIVKPAEQTSLTALRLAELALEAGVPPGVLNVLTGMGPDVGEPLGRHGDVDALTFTGSTEIGRRFLTYAAESNLKEVCLEMGGKSAAVVLEGPQDLARIARIQAGAIFWNMGENCTANSRIIVHRSHYKALLAELAEAAKDWAVGDPLEPGTRSGPLVDAAQHRKVTGLVETGRAEGARLIAGGAGVGDLGFAPTIFADVTPEMTIFREEIFGPVLAVCPADSDDAAIELANATEYGLAATLYTGDLGKAHRCARRLQAGTVAVNGYSEGEISTPFGGMKASGFGGRDNGIAAHEQYTELKTIWFDLSEA